jgi:hypothetical protein
MIMAIDKPERGKDTTYGKSERGTTAITGGTVSEIYRDYPRPPSL